MSETTDDGIVRCECGRAVPCRHCPTTPTVLVLDHQAGRVTLDGREVAGFHQITDAIEVETVDGYVGMVTISLLARNLIVRSRSGETSSPTASDEARRIVRHGLAEVLRWLGEEQRTSNETAAPVGPSGDVPSRGADQ